MEASRLPPTKAGPAVDSDRAGVLRPELANVIALSADPALLEQLREAVDNRHRLWRAENVTHAAELAVAASPGVLLIDSAVTAPDTADVVVRLRRQLPALCVLVTGRRDDEAQVAALISSGDVYRFLHKPLSVERARNFIDAAVRRQQTQTEAAPDPRPATAGAEPSPRRERARSNPAAAPGGWMRPLPIAGAVLLCLGAAWYATSRDPAPVQPEAATARAAAAAPRSDTRSATLAAARRALDAGQLIDPPGRNAVQLFKSVLAAEPGNAAAQAGLHAAAEALLDSADRHLASGDLLGAANMLDAARLAEPASARLAALRTRLETVRAAQNAAPPPGSIKRLDPTTVPQTGQQEARSLVGRARSRIAAGDLVDGPESAAALLSAARQANPRDREVTEELRRLADLLTQRARQAIDTRRFAEGLRWIGALDSLDVGNAEVERLRGELEAARKLSSREDNLRLLTLANQRIAQDRLIDPEGDSARHYLDLLRASDSTFPGLAESGQTLAARALAALPELLKARRWTDAERMLQAAAAQNADANALRQAEDALKRARAAAAVPAAPPLVAESRLQRVRAVGAAYPSRAASKGIEGTVDAEFTIGTDGAPRNIVILTASPPEIFDQAVIEAIRQWRYQPAVVDGRIAEVRTRARLRFKLSDR